MLEERILSWAEVQQLMLPPNAAMLIPPPPESVESATLAAGPPNTEPDWLDDGFFAESPNVQRPVEAATPVEAVDADEVRAAKEREEYGPGPVRLLANLITVNAVLEWANSTTRKEEDKKRRIPLGDEPEPTPPS